MCAYSPVRGVVRITWFSTNTRSNIGPVYSKSITSPFSTLTPFLFLLRIVTGITSKSFSAFAIGASSSALVSSSIIMRSSIFHLSFGKSSFFKTLYCAPSLCRLRCSGRINNSLALFRPLAPSEIETINARPRAPSTSPVMP